MCEYVLYIYKHIHIFYIVIYVLYILREELVNIIVFYSINILLRNSMKRRYILIESYLPKSVHFGLCDQI